MSQLYKDAIFWIDVNKIQPGKYQPRKEFNEESLRELAESISQYGILQPLVVTRVEEFSEDGGMEVKYELISGERRLRASKIAGLHQVPVIIRKGDDDKVRFELAIIENIQREDLNPRDRALAFKRLMDEFNMTAKEVAGKVGKSRSYVANSIRLLDLPEEILEALSDGKITEGHAKTLLMVKDKPEEQMALFKEILHTKMTVKDAEEIIRSQINPDKRYRKSSEYSGNPEIKKIERKIAEKLGTRVTIKSNKGKGGKIVINYFSGEDLQKLIDAIEKGAGGGANDSRGDNSEIEKIYGIERTDDVEQEPSAGHDEKADKISEAGESFREEDGGGQPPAVENEEAVDGAMNLGDESPSEGLRGDFATPEEGDSDSGAEEGEKLELLKKYASGEQVTSSPAEEEKKDGVENKNEIERASESSEGDDIAGVNRKEMPKAPLNDSSELTKPYTEFGREKMTEGGTGAIEIENIANLDISEWEKSDNKPEADNARHADKSLQMKPENVQSREQVRNPFASSANPIYNTSDASSEDSDFSAQSSGAQQKSLPDGLPSERGFGGESENGKAGDDIFSDMMNSAPIPSLRNHKDGLVADDVASVRKVNPVRPQSVNPFAKMFAKSGVANTINSNLSGATAPAQNRPVFNGEGRDTQSYSATTITGGDVRISPEN